MKRIHLIASSLVLTFALAACVTMPLTQRAGLLLIPSAQLNTLAADNYKEVLGETVVITTGEQAEMVRRVGEKLAEATERYLLEHSVPSPGFAWEFNLLDEPEVVNAWCMPGGKVAVYTGLLPITQDENGLAVVMGHEIAHALLKHGNERMSQALVVQGLGATLQLALRKEPQRTQETFLKVYGAGTSVGALLPYSRLHEGEADTIGIELAAMGGYDPRASISLWQRMDEKSKGQRPPQFLSTHPEPQNRIQKLQEHMPTAMAIYERNRAR
jgi:predicted Zn-dependent protease